MSEPKVSGRVTSIDDVRFVRPEDVNSTTDEICDGAAAAAHEAYFDQLQRIIDRRREELVTWQRRVDTERRTTERTICVRRRIHP